MPVLLLISGGTLKAQKNTAERVYKKVNPAVVTIFSYDAGGQRIGQASGVVIDKKGNIATNLHLLHTGDRMISSMEIRQGNQVYAVSGIRGYDQDNDLMIMTSQAAGLPAVPLANSDEVAVGQKIYTVGSPAGFENSISEGIVSGVRTEGALKRIQLTAPVSSGSSGGAAVNAKGELIGICNMIIGNAQNINFAIPSNALRNLALREPARDFSDMASFFTCAGEYQLENEAYQAAFHYFSEARARKEDADILIRLAQTARLNKSIAVSIRYARKALAYKPEAPGALMILARAYLTYDKKDSSFYYINRLLKADSLQAEAWFLKAEWAMRSQHCREAIGLAEKAAQLGYKDPDRFRLLAFCHGLNGQYRQAIDLANQYLAFNPKDEEMLVSLGTSYYGLEYYNEACDRAKAAIRINPASGEALLLLGMAEQKLRHFREAEEAALQLIRLEPDNPAGYGLMCNISVNRSDLATAMNYSRKVLEIDSAFSTAYSIASLYYLKRNMTDSALYFRQLGRLHETDSIRFFTPDRRFMRNRRQARDPDPDNGSCTFRIGGNNYRNPGSLVYFKETPLLSMNDWKEKELPVFSMDLYTRDNRLRTKIVNNKRVSGDPDYVQITSLPDECMVIEKESQVILFHAKREAGEKGCIIQVWLNMVIPGSDIFQASPEASNSRNYFGSDNTFTNIKTCFSFE